MHKNRQDLNLHSTFPLMPFLRGDGNISKATFDAFLAWLDPDRDQAARKYEDTRCRLIKIFASRGCTCPEDLADETINRVIGKIEDINGCYQGDPGPYFGGVARHVFHEYARRPGTPVVVPEADPPDAHELELACLDQCLGELSEGNRWLILSYHEGEKGNRIGNRSKMASALGTELNALRIRAHRIRSALRKCIAECLGKNIGR